MTALLVVTYLLTAAAGTAVVLTRDTVHQSVVLGVYGLVLTVLYVVVQAPDVALSQLVVGAAVTPLLVLLAVVKVRQRQQ